jgi:hypothetical protein
MRTSLTTSRIQPSFVAAASHCPMQKELVACDGRLHGSVPLTGQALHWVLQHDHPCSTSMSDCTPAAPCRGLYELGQYSFQGVYKGSKGLTFSKFSDKGCGMSAVLIILALEWFLFMGLAYYLEQVLSSGGGQPGAAGLQHGVALVT